MNNHDAFGGGYFFTLLLDVAVDFAV